MPSDDDELAKRLAKKLTEVLGDAFPPTAHAVKFLPSPPGTIRAELTLELRGPVRISRTMRLGDAIAHFPRRVRFTGLVHEWRFQASEAWRVAGELALTLERDERRQSVRVHGEGRARSVRAERITHRLELVARCDQEVELVDGDEVLILPAEILTPETRERLSTS